MGAPTQIGGTALMLLTMEQRSFVVTVAYLKTEPVLVALMGLVFLHDPLTPLMALAIVIAMAGVALISVKPGAGAAARRPALLGLVLGRPVRRVGHRLSRRHPVAACAGSCWPRPFRWRRG